MLCQARTLQEEILYNYGQVPDTEIIMLGKRVKIKLK